MRTSSDSATAVRQRVLIGLGSNVGDRLAWLRLGRHRIAALPSTRTLTASAVFETSPVGGPPQGPYLNACLTAETELSPHAFLDALLAIEEEAGRVRAERNAPRTLDLDILLCGEQEIAGPRLTVPHPRFAQRAFALIPSAEIAGSWHVPPSMTDVAALAALIPTSGIRRFCGEDEWR